MFPIICLVVFVQAPAAHEHPSFSVPGRGYAAPVVPRHRRETDEELILTNAVIVTAEDISDAMIGVDVGANAPTARVGFVPMPCSLYHSLHDCAGPPRTVIPSVS